MVKFSTYHSHLIAYYYFLNKYRLQTFNIHFEIEIFTDVYKFQHVRLNNFKNLRPFNNHSELYVSYN